MKSFELSKKETDITNEEIEKHYVDISCRAKLILPNGLSEEHSAILNERLEKSMHFKLQIHELDGEHSSQTLRSRSIKRGVRFNKIDNIDKAQYRLKRSIQNENHLSLYEMEIVEGPIRLYRDNFKGALNASCALSLRDFDNTYAFNSFMNSTIYSQNSIVGSMMAPTGAAMSQSNAINFFTLYICLCIFIFFNK